MANDFIGIKIEDVNGTVLSHHLYGAKIKLKELIDFSEPRIPTIQCREEADIEFTG